MKPAIGRTYVVRHKHKGTFRLRVTNITGDADEWVTGLLVEGHAVWLLGGKSKVGDLIVIRRDLCDFVEVKV